MRQDPPSSKADIRPAGLKEGAVGLPGILMQAITHIGPALGVVASLQFTVALAGAAAPLAFVAAFIVVLPLGISITQLAKNFPAAGGYLTYVSRTVSPHAGLFTSWMYMLYDPFAAFINIAFTSSLVQVTLQSAYGVDLPWWVVFVVSIVGITILMYRGIALSVQTIVFLGLAEILITVVLALTGLIHPGAGGFSFTPFDIARSPSANSFYLAVVFSIFTFTGFEAVAPLAEETKDPRRTLPRAIMLSICLMGVFFVLAAWGIIDGWGVNHIGSLVGSSANPVIAYAQRVWSGAWIIVLIATVNSALAISLAAGSASTRVFYALGRTGAGPAWLGKTHPRYRTPKNAILFQGMISLGLGLFFGSVWLGPQNTLFFFGTALTLGLIIVYGLGNLGVYLYYRKERRAEFRPFVHLVCPLLSTAALIWVGYKSIVPLPAAPVRYAPFVAGGWVVVGLVLVAVRARTGSDRWLAATRAIYEGSGSPAAADEEAQANG